MHISPVRLYSYPSKMQFKSVNQDKRPEFFGDLERYRLNAGIVDGTLSRSSAPMYDDLVVLKEYGVKHIIDFREDRGETAREMALEALACDNLGIKYHCLPVDTHDKNQPSDEKIQKFFDIIDDAKQHKEKVHIHCQAGADRTGFFTLLYKTKYGIGNLDANISEMKHDYGHDYMYYPHLIRNAESYINNHFIKQL